VRVIEGFALADGRRVMVDRGFRRNDIQDEPLTATTAKVVGNLHWPDEIDSFTPAPDPKAGLWFARDVPAMAAVLNTEPVMIVAKEASGDGIDPMPVDSGSIPNNHFGYAIQWFSFAAVWLGMTAYLLWRIRRRSV
jgi:surfeit locus 1 family protein